MLVGLAEGLVFRGVVLRCLRTHRRPASSAALWTAVGFGLYGLGQLALAALPGYALYLFRRWSDAIWVAMVAHGIWDNLRRSFQQDGGYAVTPAAMEQLQPARGLTIEVGVRCSDPIRQQLVAVGRSMEQASLRRAAGLGAKPPPDPGLLR